MAETKQPCKKEEKIMEQEVHQIQEQYYTHVVFYLKNNNVSKEMNRFCLPCDVKIFPFTSWTTLCGYTFIF